MSAQPLTLRSALRNWASDLNKVKQKLSVLGLLDVLDSFPPTTFFAFHDGSFQGKKANKFQIGHRVNIDNTLEEVWAYIILGGDVEEPPVMIQIEEPLIPKSNKNPSRWPRPASLLLRKAEKLFPPFCFLQTDPSANPRNMLCALILYYTLINDQTETATKWSHFEISLIEALIYINDRAEYKQWREECVDDADLTASETSEAEPGHDSDADKKKGGVVSSRGSTVSVRSGATMAKLKEALGNDRVNLLDAIPPSPVTIERHNIDKYWPFRLYLARFGGRNVYVYLKHGWRTDCKILAHQTDETTWRWKFSDLGELQLLEPFACIMKLDQDLTTRGNKIRSLVYYYFMLAENEGLIDDPKLQVTKKSTIAICAACKNLEEADYNRVEAQHQLQVNQGNGNQEVYLRINSGLIMAQKF
jgi:hypothetical protein